MTAKPIRTAILGRKPATASLLRWLSTQPAIDVVAVVTDDVSSPTGCVATELGFPLVDYGELEHLQFDLGLSVYFWDVVRPPILTRPALGFINFHPAPLPEHRGMGGYNFAVLEGWDRYGVTAHYMDCTVDTGPIIERIDFDIDASSMTAADIGDLAMAEIEDLCRKVVERVITEGVLPTSENGDGRRVLRSEMESLKTIRPGDDVDAKARAFWFPPFTGALVEVNGELHTVVPHSVLRRLGDAFHSVGDHGG